MVVVTGSNIYSETWNLLYGVISGNVSDPAILRPAKTTRFILGAFPDLEGPNLPTFPIVVIENPKKDSTKSSISPTGIITNQLETSVFSYSKSPREMNIISEDVSDAILTNRLGLASSGFSMPEVPISDGTQGTDIVGNQRIHFREQIIRGTVVS